ncbi:MAG: hypothetical protein AABY07_06005, partial [Nanoarchaeota archaeon]
MQLINGTNLTVPKRGDIIVPIDENVTIFANIKNNYTKSEDIDIKDVNVTFLISRFDGFDFKIFKNIGNLKAQEESLVEFLFNSGNKIDSFNTSIGSLGIDNMTKDLHRDLFSFNLVVRSFGIHNIGLKENYDGFGHSIRIKNASNDVVPDDIVNFEPNDTIDIQFITENKGNFIENVSIELAILNPDGSAVFKESKIKTNLAIGESTTTGNKNNFVLDFPIGIYNITVNISLINFDDANLEDNFAFRTMILNITQLPECDDKIDNDEDGAVDYPADFSCDSKIDNDEFLPKSQCQNGIDDDDDELIDLLDPGCDNNNQDNNESDKTSQCQDKIDNDQDGAVDYPADFSCDSKID